MLNALLTTLSKVNVPSVESTGNTRGRHMKKQTRDGFWSWLLGSGWTNTGANG